MEITKKKFGKTFSDGQRSSSFYFWHKTCLWTKLEGESVEVSASTEVSQPGQSSSVSWAGRKHQTLTDHRRFTPSSWPHQVVTSQSQLVWWHQGAASINITEVCVWKRDDLFSILLNLQVGGGGGAGWQTQPWGSQYYELTVLRSDWIRWFILSPAKKQTVSQSQSMSDQFRHVEKNRFRISFEVY